MINKIKQIDRYKIALIIFIMVVIGSGIIYWIVDYNNDKLFQQVHLFFTDDQFSKLYKEDQMIKKVRSLEKRVKNTLALLISGPSEDRLTSLLPYKTKIKSVWFFNHELHISFSKELVQDINSKIWNEKLIIDSLVATFFHSFSEVKKIRFYLEDKPLKTILGWHDFNHYYDRKSFN